MAASHIPFQLVPKVQRDAERSMQEISLQDIIQSFEERVQRDSADDAL